MVKELPDCIRCVWADDCRDARQGFFCPRFASKKPDVDLERDPNAAWLRGDPSPYDVGDGEVWP